MSLRARLILVFVVLFLAGMAVIFGRSLHAARIEVLEEIEFSRQVVGQFIELLAPSIPENGDALEARRRMLAQLRGRLQGLETAEKFDIEVNFRELVRGRENVIDTTQLTAPQWFLEVLGLDASRLTLEHRLPSGETLSVLVDPVGKINEIWQEINYTFTTRLGSLLTIVMLLYLLVGYWMRPVGHVLRALDSLVEGDYRRQLPEIPLKEINEVGQKVNYLAEVLGTGKAENERLTHKAMTVQEQERRYLAQELHDTLGQAVSAIKAMAVSIANRSRDQSPTVSESAHNIERISDEAYQSVRNLMAWLRPAILDELGLTLALQQMVDDWNAHHEDTFCNLRIDSDLSGLDAQRRIQVYRIVQEALTNVAKHAAADRVEVSVAGGVEAELLIRDNGKGFDVGNFRSGIGMANIRDRANLLQGNSAVISSPGRGTTVRVTFPLQGPERKVEHGRE